MGYDDNYFNRDIPEQWFGRHGLLRPDQLAALCYALNWPFWVNGRTVARNPGLIVSMGCGQGLLEKKLEDMGYKVIGVDPNFGDIYQGSTRVEKYEGLDADTLMFVESIEHIPKDEILRVVRSLRSGARVIVTNFPDFHPIDVDNTGWDHITRIDDDFYNELLDGREPVVRRGSHLVFDV